MNSLATNFAMDFKPKDIKKTLREHLSEQSGQLCRINKSPLVNHIGVICMVESADGFIIVQKRSSGIANRPNTFSSSVSGALDWKDFSSGKEAHLEGAVREGVEELGIILHDIEFLGLVREFLRGGKPEMYFYTKSKYSFEEIKNNWTKAKDRQESDRLSGYHLDTANSSNFTFQKNICDIIENVGNKANLTLVAGLLLLADSIIIRDDS